MSSIFGLRSSYMLEYRGLFALLLRSARYFTGVEGKWTPLPPISPPSSQNVTVEAKKSPGLQVAAGDLGEHHGVFAA